MKLYSRRSDDPASYKKRASDSGLLMLITVVFFAVMYTGAVVFLKGGFQKPQTFFNMLNSNASLIIISCGMTLVMITGGIDISVGAVTALICTSCAVNLDMSGGNIASSIAVAMMIGILFGLVQGFMVAYLKIQPFIVSLAGMFMAKGLTTTICSDQFNVENRQLNALRAVRVYIPGVGSYSKSGKFIPAYIEPGVIAALLTVVILFVFLRWSRQGRNFYAVGGNSQSAEMMGIDVKKARFTAHLMSGILSGIGGYVYFLHVGSCSPSHAEGAEMNAIASSIIGGTLLSGGSGNIAGTFFGVLSLSTIKNIVSSLGLDDAWWTNITVAAMICIFIILQSVLLRLRKRDLK